MSNLEFILIPIRTPIYLINAVYFRRGASAVRLPHVPGHESQAVRPHEGAAHPRRGGVDQAVSTENGAQLEDVQKTAQATADPSTPSLYASGVALSQPTRTTPLPIIVAANA